MSECLFGTLELDNLEAVHFNNTQTDKSHTSWALENMECQDRPEEFISEEESSDMSRPSDLQNDQL